MSCSGKSSGSCQLCQSFQRGVFSDLSEEELLLLEQCKTSNKYKKKQVVFYEGNPVVGVYCVRSGKIKLFKTSSTGKQQITKIAQKGDILGHSALFVEAPHAVTAEVLDDSEICFLDRARFLALLRTNVSVSLKLLAQVSRELNRSEEQALDLAYKSVRVRFVEFLLTLKQTFGVLDNGVYRIDITLSREELAQAIGTTTETAVRLLSEFRADGLVEIEKKSISLLDAQKLLKYTEVGY